MEWWMTLKKENIMFVTTTRWMEFERMNISGGSPWLWENKHVRSCSSDQLTNIPAMVVTFCCGKRRRWWWQRRRRRGGGAGEAGTKLARDDH